MILASPAVAAEAPPAVPSVGQLLAVCERGYANRNKGVDAAACEWFANPCECKPAAAGRDGAHWCISAAEPADVTVRKVFGELRRQPDPAAPVDLVVPDILARLYPCDPGAGP